MDYGWRSTTSRILLPLPAPWQPPPSRLLLLSSNSSTWRNGINVVQQLQGSACLGEEVLLDDVRKQPGRLIVCMGTIGYGDFVTNFKSKSKRGTWVKVEALTDTIAFLQIPLLYLDSPASGGSSSQAQPCSTRHRSRTRRHSDATSLTRQRAWC
jgi:hypothetical protein